MKYFLFILWPLSMVYRLGVYIHKNIISPDNVDVPVISVGNITSGGTGKTPLTLKIVDLLDKSLKIAVLLRGYGRKTKGVKIVSVKEDFHLTDFKKFGDEAVLIKMEKPAIIVIVGENRAAAADAAIREGADIIILDDGFQSWELQRDIDIIVIDCTLPFGGGQLLPVGTLREPLTANNRADCIVLNRSNMVDETVIKKITDKIKKINSNALFFYSQEKINCFRELSGNRKIQSQSLKGKKAICFSGIGNPKGFYYLLKDAGIKIVKEISKKDHYLWTEKEINKIVKYAISNNLEIITTQKDAVRLPKKITVNGWELILGINIKEKEKFKKIINEIKI